LPIASEGIRESARYRNTAIGLGAFLLLYVS
jgi:hypothetical protein